MSNNITAQGFVSELVTNAVIHAGPYSRGEDVAVDVECSAGVVRVAVTDCGGGTVVRGDGATDGLSGRGLLLVDALADSWGVTEYGSGRVVWFEVSVYLDHDAGWFYDKTADGYEPNGFRGDNCIVDLTGPSVTPSKRGGLGPGPGATRGDLHNIDIDEEVAATDLCGTVDLRNGRTCIPRQSPSRLV